jgi:FK506-binding nuclear protein
VVPPDDGADALYDPDEDEEDYDLSPDEEELEDEDDEEDALDELEDPRVTEVDSDEDDAVPTLLSVADKKGKNKRAADEIENESSNLDDIITKSLKPAEAAPNGERKLSKKERKKLKNNSGKAVSPPSENASGKGGNAAAEKDQPGKKSGSDGKAERKVQFAKNLEQGPSSSPKADSKPESTKDGKPKASLGIKTIQGVKVDDKKLGEGPTAKKGDKVSVRYIGKLEKDNKVFDCKAQRVQIYYQRKC